MRPDWNETWMGIADIMARRSTCAKRQVGAVLVGPDRVILSTGYNGAPVGQPHCIDPGVGCLILATGKCGRAIHAELNALLRASRFAVRGATLYVTLQPCFSCASLAVNMGVLRVVYRVSHSGRNIGAPDSTDFLNDCGVEVIRLE